MRIKKLLFVVVAVALVSMGFLAGRTRVKLGNPDSPDVPGNTYSYTLEDIYNWLKYGMEVTQSTFTEPTSGPGTPTMHSLNEIMDLMKSTCFPRVPKTGQTTFYRTGDDGDYKLGVSPELSPSPGTSGAYTVYGWGGTRFTDHGDGTVTDNWTRLMWTENADHGWLHWNAAIDYCNDYSFAGYDDWRLPNINELHSLIDLTQSNPALPAVHPFTDVQAIYYWSSTTYTDDSSWAWRVDPDDGVVTREHKEHLGYALNVWPVRGGQ